MTENSESLRAALDELHEQLDHVEAGNPEVREMIRNAIGDLRSTLEASPDRSAPPTEDESLPERLEEAAVHFEGSHPVLAGTVRKLIDALSQMGI